MYFKFFMSVIYDNQGKAVSISFGETVFQIIDNEAQGDCFLRAVLQYLEQKNIDPLLGTGNGNRQVDANEYRQFLITRLLNPTKLNDNNIPLLNNNGEEIPISGGENFKNPDGQNGLSFYGNITKVNDVLWKNFRTKLRIDFASHFNNKKENACKQGTYLSRFLFKLIVVLYKEIKNIYVYQKNTDTKDSEKGFEQWVRYFIDKEPKKNYAVVRGGVMKKKIRATENSSMFIRFTSSTSSSRSNHFELMKPIYLDEITVNEESVRSEPSNIQDLTDGDDNESTMKTNDALLTDIIRQANNPLIPLIQLSKSQNTCLWRAGYRPRKQKDGSKPRYEQEDAMEAFNRLAEHGELYRNPDKPSTTLEKGSDILKSFYARQFKTTKCTDPNNGFERKETPRDERLTIIFEDEINPLSTYVERQIEKLKTPNQWRYDDVNENYCDAEQTLRYEFYDYVLIELKIFTTVKRKFTEYEQQTLIGNGTLDLPTVDDDDDQEFQLIGSINHQGETQNSGHYVAYVKKQTGWYLCNDHIISRPYKDYPYFEDYQPYILFYKRSRIDLDNIEPKGIKNEGNSCYINALLQNIINVPELFIRKQLRSSATSSGSNSGSRSAPSSGSRSATSSGSGSGSRSKKSNKRAKILNELADVRKEKHEKWKQMYTDKSKNVDNKKTYSKMYVNKGYKVDIRKQIKELDNIIDKSTDIGLIRNLFAKKKKLEKQLNDIQISDTSSEEMNIDDENNDKDDESKDGDERRSKKQRTLAPEIDEFCKGLLNSARKGWTKLKNRKKYKTFEEYMEYLMKLERCTAQQKINIRNEIQKRSLISLSRMTL